MATGSGSQLSVCFYPRTCSRLSYERPKGLFPNSLRNHLLLPTIPIQSLWDHLTLIPITRLNCWKQEQSELFRLKTNHTFYHTNQAWEITQPWYNWPEGKEQRLLIESTYFSIREQQAVVAEKLCELLHELVWLMKQMKGLIYFWWASKRSTRVATLYRFMEHILWPTSKMKDGKIRRRYGSHRQRQRQGKRMSND